MVRADDEVDDAQHPGANATERVEHEGNELRTVVRAQLVVLLALGLLAVPDGIVVPRQDVTVGLGVGTQNGHVDVNRPAVGLHLEVGNLAMTLFVTDGRFASTDHFGTTGEREDGGQHEIVTLEHTCTAGMYARMEVRRYQWLLALAVGR